MPRPNRGDVWLVDLGNVGKTRPAVVLSIPPLEGDLALVTLIPHTTSTRDSRFEVKIPQTFLQAGAFDTQNPVTIPLAKLIRRLGGLPPDEFTKIEAAVKFWLGLE